MLAVKKVAGSKWVWLIPPRTHIVADVFTPVGGLHLPPLLLRSLALSEGQHPLVLQHMLPHTEQVKRREGREGGGGRRGRVGGEW